MPLYLPAATTVPAPVHAFKSSDQTTTSTSLVDVTGDGPGSLLAVSVDANTLYDIDCWIRFSTTNASNDPGLALVGPTSSSVRFRAVWQGDTAGGSPDASVTEGWIHYLSDGTNSSEWPAVVGTGITTALGMHVTGRIRTGATAGTLKLQLKSTNASTTAAVLAGSLLALTKIG